MKIQLTTPALPNDLKGRITKPSKGLDDPAFKWTPAIHTNLAETFRRARRQLRMAS